MSESYARRSRRPDSRQMWDESDRRRPTDRDRPREPRRDHDDRDDRRRDRRRYRSRTRSRSRERRPERDGGRGRRGEERNRHGEERTRHRGDERRREDEGRAEARGVSARSPRGRDVDERREDGPRRERGHSRGITSHEASGREIHTSNSNNLKDKHRRRSASPQRSPARSPDDDAYLDTLPTRTKPDSRKAMSFRVGRADTPERGRSPAPVMDVDEGEEEEGDDDDVEVDDGMDMQAMMGFGGFGTTKGKKVAGNKAYAVRKEKKTVYRQYMNRTKGFNRPLSPSR